MLTGSGGQRRSHSGDQTIDHHPGAEKSPSPEHFRSDDCLWFFNAVPAYVAETGDLDFY
jgi:cellobiose phosphorylase